MDKMEIKKIFEDLKVLRYGHFLLTSARHSDSYMQCARLLEEPQYTEKVVKYLAEKFKNQNIDIVIGPATGGIILSYEFAKQLGAKSYFTERENEIMTLRRGFEIPKAARVLIVEDVITTGGSVKEVIELVEREGGEIVGMAVIADRTGGKIDFNYPLVSGFSEEILSYTPENCPICKENRLPLEKPGSRKEFKFHPIFDKL